MKKQALLDSLCLDNFSKLKDLNEHSIYKRSFI